MLNIGFAYGKPLVEKAKQAGVAPIASSLAIWIPALIGGFFVNLAFTSFQIQKRKSWGKFAQGGAGLWLRSSSMGLLWFTCILLYGVANPMLGHAGSVYGWAINAGASIITSSTWGFVMGEWANATWGAKRLLLCGIALIVSASFVLCRAIAVSWRIRRSLSRAAHSLMSFICVKPPNMDVKFHTAIWNASGRPLLRDTLIEVSRPLFVFFQINWSRYKRAGLNLAAVARSHSLVLDYIERKTHFSAADCFRPIIEETEQDENLS